MKCKTQFYIVKLKKAFFYSEKINSIPLALFSCLQLFYMPNVNLNILLYSNLKIDI